MATSTRQSLAEIYHIEYPNSRPYPKELFDANDIPSVLQPRVGLALDRADKGCLDCRKDLKDAGVSEASMRAGGMNDVCGNGNAFWFPEAMPDRLELNAYIFEFLFVDDDKYEMRPNKTLNNLALPKRAIYESMLARLPDMDPILGREYIGVVRDYLQRRKTTQHATPSTFNEYLELRHIDAASEISMAAIRFILGIHISTSEAVSLQPLIVLANRMPNLINDYYSYDKERQAFDNSSEVFNNSLSYIMRERGVDLVEARGILKRIVGEREEEYLKARDEYLEKNTPAERVIRYIDGVECFVVGNTVWSQSAPRYKVLEEYKYHNPIMHERGL